MKPFAESLVKLRYLEFGYPIVALTFLGALLGTAGCGKQGAQAAPTAPPPALVTVAQAVAQDVPVYLDEIGKNYASESVTITPQISGKIVERTFSDGADLKKDQLLFTIDPRPYQAQLDSAQAQLAQSKAALDLANTQLKIYASVSDTRAVSQLDYETKKNTVASNKAQVQAAEAAVENAKLNLEYCHIRSPIDGRAGARLVDVGNVVQANTTALLSIQQLDPIYADFTVTERDLPEVRREMDRGNSKTMVRIPSDPENAARAGKLTFLDNAVQNGTGTVNLARDGSQRRSPFLARPVRERQADFVDGQRSGAGSEPGHADQPARAVRLRRQAGQYRRASAGDAGAAARRRCCRHQRGCRRRTCCRDRAVGRSPGRRCA